MPRSHPRPRRFPAVLALLALGLGLGEPAARAADARHAIVVVIDGVRWSEGLGDPAHAWYGRQVGELAPLGCRVNDFRNLGPAITVPGMSACLSGQWQNLPNDGSEPSHYPSLFECWRMASGAPATDAWLVTTKPKLAMLVQSDHPASGPQYAGSAAVAADDSAAWGQAVAVLGQYHPSVLMLHLGDTDLAGHSGDWVRYTACIRRADSLVAELWQVVQADTALAGRTALFVTNDHGRHLDAYGGFTNHGDDCDGCHHIGLVAIGAGLHAGFASPAHYRQIDLLPTIGALLDFPTPWALGTAMDGLLVHPTHALAVSSPPPSRFAFAPVRPNPSRGPVRLELALPVAGAVHVAVYDAAGRLVARLHDGPLPAGTHGLAWDGRDAAGVPARAGWYVVRATTPGAAVSTRVLRVR